ncbi:serine hydrolase domain-containing protein [Nocardia aurea]
MKPSIDRMFGRGATVGAVVGIVRGHETAVVSAHGLADIATARPVDADTVFRIASITKTFTAVAVLQLWQRGRLDLDAPANEYLRSYRLAPSPRFALPTVRQLLTHTAGIGETARPTRLLRPDFGESVPPGHAVPTLSEFYRGALKVQAEPGTRWTYSNHGFATLGQLVEDVSGTALDEYLREHVFGPLGMHDTGLVHRRSDRARHATGYVLRADGPHPVIRREMVTVGAASANSTARDLCRYLSALVGGGANQYGAVLDPGTLTTMFAPQYQPDPRIPGMGLGFFRARLGAHQVIEHQGILPGFDSQIWAAPDAGVGVVALTTGAHRGMLWLPAATAALMRDVLGVPEPVIRSDIGHSPEIWHDICGYYRLPGALTDVRARGMVGAGVRVAISGGRPVLRVATPIPTLMRGLALYPDDERDPWVFRLDLSRFGMDTVRIVFRHVDRTTTMHLEPMPMTMRKAETFVKRRGHKVLSTR